MHYNGADSYLFVNGTEIPTFKAKDSENNGIPLSLGDFSKEYSVDNMTKAVFCGHVYGFSVKYNAVAFNDILSIHKYLMKKHGIV